MDARDTLQATFPLGETLDGILRTVLLYLPHCRQAGLVSLALDDGATVMPRIQPVMLALGDSITQGMESPYPSLTWPAVAARRLGMDVHNAGIGGHFFEAAALPEQPVKEPTLITVAYGTNDWNIGWDVAHARTYLARLRELYPATPLAVLEPIWWEGHEEQAHHGCTFAAYREELRAIALAFHPDYLLPMSALLPPGPCLLADGVHPSAAGHVVMGENVALLLQAAVHTR